MSNRSWLRRCWHWLSPTTLLGAAVLFCLPWIDVRCDSTIHGSEKTGSERVLTQSGLQAALGGRFTTNRAYGNQTFPGADVFRGLYGTSKSDEAQSGLSPAGQLAAYYLGETRRKSVALEERQAELALARDQAETSCWLLMTYGIMIGVGILGGILLPVGRRRAALLVVISGISLAVLTMQSSEGFPIRQWVAAENKALQRVHEEYEGRLFLVPPELKLIYTWWYFGAFALPGVVFMAALAECSLCSTSRVMNQRSGVGTSGEALDSAAQRP